MMSPLRVVIVNGHGFDENRNQKKAVVPPSKDLQLPNEDNHVHA